MAGEAASRWPGSPDRSGSLACRLPGRAQVVSGWCVPLAFRAQAPGDHTMIHSAIYRPQSCVPSPPLGAIRVLVATGLLALFGLSGLPS